MVILGRFRPVWIFLSGILRPRSRVSEPIDSLFGESSHAPRIMVSHLTFHGLWGVISRSTDYGELLHAPLEETGRIIIGQGDLEAE